MNTPRCLILLESVHHGNTAKVAEALSQVLAADIVAPDKVPSSRLAEYAVVGFGSGVYYGQMHHALTDWLNGLPDAAYATTPAFVFSTSGLPFLAKIWTAPLRRLLARKGFDVVGEFACRGFDTWGPLWLTGGLNQKHPDEHDLARAAEFAKRIVRATQASPAGQSASAA